MDTIFPQELHQCTPVQDLHLQSQVWLHFFLSEVQHSNITQETPHIRAKVVTLLSLPQITSAQTHNEEKGQGLNLVDPILQM